MCSIRIGMKDRVRVLPDRGSHALQEALKAVETLGRTSTEQVGRGSPLSSVEAKDRDPSNDAAP